MFRIGSISAVFFLAAFIQTAFAAESTGQTVHYLIDQIAKSDATFIRNGQSHSPAAAADHIKAKYEHFKGKIKTPEDFIRLCGTKSAVSNQPYKVRTRDGKEMPLSSWLNQALQAHRAGKHE